MPTALMNEAVETEGEDIDLLDDFLILRLSEKFGVSEQALGIRLKNLGNSPL